MSSPFTDRLLNWYSTEARSLPWRNHPDPYAVWVSEIMLQQTRVETVLPYFSRWMRRFPTIASLAEADLQDVLNLWEGLGYYSRARNLHRAARRLMEAHHGELPAQAALLRRLPGIGRYTAGAIASMAFGLDEPALDGNIRRVLARVFNVQEPDRSPQGERRLWELAAGHLPPGRAGDYNQALMDLGARVCTPRQPACPACPVSQACQAYALGLQEQLPRRLPRRQTPHYQVAAAVIQRAGRVLIARRPENGLLGGLWEFPGGKRHPHESLAECLRREIGEELGAAIEVGDELGVYRHAFTHFRVTLHAFTARLVNGAQPQPHEHSALAWAAPDELGGFPMGKIDRQIAGDLLRQGSGRR